MLMIFLNLSWWGGGITYSVQCARCICLTTPFFNSNNSNSDRDLFTYNVLDLMLNVTHCVTVS